MADPRKKILNILLKTLKVFGIIFGCLWIIVIVALQIVLTDSFLKKTIDKYIPDYIVGARLEYKNVSASAIKSFPYLRVDIDSAAVVYDHDKFASYDSLEKLGNVLSGFGRSQEADTLLSFRKLSVAVNYFSLITGTVNIHDIRTEKMRVFARQFPENVSNWDIFKSSGEDVAEEPDSAGVLPDVVLRRLALGGGTFIVYTNPADTLYAAIGVRDFVFDGRIALQDPFGSRVGLKIDSLFVAGRTATDTVAAGLRSMRIKPSFRYHDISASGRTFLALQNGTRMNLPFTADGSLRLPEDNFSKVSFRDLTLSAASLAVSGEGNLEFSGDSTYIDTRLKISDCKIADLLKDFAPLLGPSVSTVKTDATVSASLSCDGYYVTGSDKLPPLEIELSIPHSNISVDGLGRNGYLQAELRAAADSSGFLNVRLEDLDVSLSGARLRGKAGCDNVLGADPLLILDLLADADFDRLSTFLPEGTWVSGKISAGIRGNALMSNLRADNFSGANLDGHLTSDGVTYRDSSVSALLGKTSLSLSKSSKKLKIERGNVLTFEGEIDTLSVDMAPSTFVRASRIGISARNADRINLAEGVQYSPVMLNLTLSKARMAGEDSLFVFMKGSNSFAQVSYKIVDGKKAPMLTVSSDNDLLALSQGRGRVALKGADVAFSAFKVPVYKKRDDRRRHLQDSLQRIWPGVPRDSLIRKYMRRRGMRQLPDYLQDKSFREKDIRIDLGEAFTEYMREWTIGGKASIDDGMIVTPSFPLRNKISGLGIRFDNNNINLDSLTLRSGRSDISANGSVTGLRSAWSRSRRPLEVKLSAKSEMLNFNEIFAALDAGQKYSSGFAADSLSELEDMESIAIDTSVVVSGPGDYPLIVVPSNINLDINLQGRRVRYSTLDVDGYNSDISMKERCLQLRNTHASSNMGRIDLECFYSTRSREDISVGFDLNLSDITADKVIDLIPAADTLMPLLKTFSGVLDCEIAATSNLDTNMNFLTSSIAGIMRIGGKNLKIEQNDALRKITRLLLFKDKQKGFVDEMSVMGIISDNVLEIFPFALSVDRYRLALGGIQNFDNNFNYHLSVLKSPIPFKFGINITGNFDKWKWRLGGAKYKSIDTPAYTRRIDAMRGNLLNSIQAIFDKGVVAAIEENRRQVNAVSRLDLAGADERSGSSDYAGLSEEEKVKMDEFLYKQDHPEPDILKN